MKVSMLVPSKRPENLERLLKSLEKNTKNKENVEIVVCVDDEYEYIKVNENVVTVHTKPNGGNVGKLNHECYKASSGDWIFIANDDLECETPDWDEQLFKAIEQFDKDQLSFFWINDKLFGEIFPCFPIVSRKVLELIKFFPTPYEHYKMDDTLRDVFPVERRIYLSSIVFRHDNFAAEGYGFPLPDGRIYLKNKEWEIKDEITWQMESVNRINMRNKIARLIPKYRPTKIMVAVPTMEFARQAMFYDFYNLLEKPAGTICTFAHGQSPAKNRNLMIEQALSNDCTHILFIDDDLSFAPNLLTKLMSHDKDVVCALQLMRNYPHRPLIFDRATEEGRCSHYFPKDGERGLIEIVACGLGAVLIKTEVFRTLEAPWVRLGELESDNWCDDIGLYKRVREAGFKLYCDLDLKVGHMATVTIWPSTTNEGVQMVIYNTNGEGTVNFPMVRP